MITDTGAQIHKKLENQPMDELEFIGKVSAQKLTTVEEDNKAAQAQYRQDMLANALRRATSKKPKVEELTRERFPEEILINEIL